MKVATNTSRFQVSGVPKTDRQLKSTCWMGVAHDLAIISQLLTCSLNPHWVQDSGLVFY